MVFFLLVSLSLVTFRIGRADSHDSGMPQTEILITPILDVTVLVVADMLMHLKTADGSIIYGEYYGLPTRPSVRERESLTVSFSSQDGMGVVKKTTDKFYKVLFRGNKTYRTDNHPLHILEDKCLENARHDMAVVQCYSDTAKKWKIEQDSALRILYESASQEFKEALQKSQDLWEQYEEGVFDAYGIHWSEEGGSAHKIWISELNSSMQKNRAMEIISYFF